MTTEQTFVDMAERIFTALGDSTYRINCQRTRGQWNGWIVVSSGQRLDEPSAPNDGEYEGGHIINVSSDTLEGAWIAMIERAEMMRDMLVLVNPLFPPQSTPHHADPLLCEAAGALTERAEVREGWRAYKAGEHGDTVPPAVAGAVARGQLAHVSKRAALKTRLDAEMSALMDRADALADSSEIAP